jgi:hypothetical protein
MSRVRASWFFLIGFTLAACSSDFDDQTIKAGQLRCTLASAGKIPAREKICSTIIEPAVELVCKEPKNCEQIESCDEAYYRLKKCGHRWLDGAGIPSKMNDIPCETNTKDRNKACGKTKEARDEARAKWPFMPPIAQSRTECKAQ